MKSAPRPLPRFLPFAVVCVALLAFGGWMAAGITKNPGFVLLFPRDAARWIATNDPTLTRAPLREHTGAVYLHTFRLTAPLPPSSLHVIAFKSVTIQLDGVPLWGESPGIERWNAERRVPIDTPLAAGEHLLTVMCVNDMGPPMFRLRWPAAGVYTNAETWYAIDAQQQAAPVREAADPVPWPTLTEGFPTTTEALAGVWPVGAAVVVVVLVMAFVVRRNASFAVAIDRYLAPHIVRGLVFVFLLVLGFHNQSRLHHDVGSDSTEHYSYIHYIAAHFQLPPLDQNAQSFQAPLFYGVAAAAHKVLILVVDEETTDRLLRMLSVLCGIGLVDVAWRMARRFIPGNAHGQRLTILLAAFFPLALIKAQVIGNEAMTGYLGALAAYLVLVLTTTSPAGARFGQFALAGTVWGLAILSKVSALVLAAPCLLALACWAWTWAGAWRRKAFAVGVYFASCAAVCGWMFARNQWLYGQFIIGGWDPLMGFEWWQAPGYRTPSDYLNFDAGLWHPLYALVQGFWDGLYAGFWFDGEYSGINNRVAGPSWNYPFATAAVGLALVPTIFFAVGAARALTVAPAPTSNSSSPEARVFALFLAGAYLASILGHSFVLPYYNAIKPAYALAAVPYMVFLIVAGLEPMLSRFWGRIVMYAWIAVWVVFVGVGYWASALPVS